METLPIFLIRVLQILAGRYGMSCSLEELTSLLSPVFNTSGSFPQNITTEKENQARVLDALLVLNDNGHIFLDSSTENSSITIKGLIKVHDKIFCN